MAVHGLRQRHEQRALPVARARPRTMTIAAPSAAAETGLYVLVAQLSRRELAKAHGRNDSFLCVSRTPGALRSPSLAILRQEKKQTLLSDGWDFWGKKNTHTFGLNHVTIESCRDQHPAFSAAHDAEKGTLSPRRKIKSRQI